jgi:tetratricopeptide (TPR) repeat protein
LAINKRKILESAQKHLQRGALDKALEDYRLLLKADPHDANVLLKVGDLYLKQGRREEAINAYLRVAQQFTRDGFDAKAVALYKQIARLDPKRQDVAVPLAELYARMGLVPDAIAALQSAADAAYRAGDKDGALELLRRMAALDPANTLNRLKLAELLAKEHHADEAAAEYEAVAEELERRGEDEERIRVLERMLSVAPDRMAERLEVARARLGAQDFVVARKLAEELLESDPDHLDAHEILGHALAGAGDLERSRETFRALAERYRLRGDEARSRDLMQRFGGLEALSLDEAEAPFDGSGVLELENDVPEEDFLLEPEPRPPPAAAPLRAAPPPPIVAPPPAPADVSKTTGETTDPDQLLAEATVYLRYGKHERAVRALRTILAAEPGHRAALESLGEALEATGETAHAVTAWQRAGEAARAASDAESLARIRERIAGVDPEAARALAPPAAAAPPLDEEIEIDLDLDLAEPFEPGPDATLASEPSPQPLALDLDTPDPLAAEEPAPDAIELAAPDAESSRPALTLHATEEPTATTPARVAEDLEEAEFYFEQGLLDEASTLYQRILAAAPNHPQAMLRLGEIAARGGPVVETPLVPGGPPPLAEPLAAASPAPPAAATAPPLAELELDIELPEPEEEPAAPPPPEPPPAAPSGDFDLAAELSQAMDADEPVGRTLAGTEEEGFEQVFHAFKTGVERELGQHDHEARYDLGIAYKEMGLLEDAIEAFRIAMAAPERQLACLYMMGLCALDVGRAADAVAHLEQALSLPELPDDQRLPLRYDLGRAYAASGDAPRARAAFEEVAASDPGFREVGAELARLASAPAGSDSDETEAGGEAYESFDDLVSGGAGPAAEVRYESFDDLFGEASDSEADAEPEAEAPPLALELEPSPPEPVAPDVAPDPEPTPEPERAPVPETKAPRRRRKISFV